MAACRHGLCKKFSRQLRLRLVELAHTFVRVDLDWQRYRGAQQHAVPGRFSDHEVVAGQAELFPEPHRERQDSPLRYVDDRSHNSMLQKTGIDENR